MSRFLTIIFVLLLTSEFLLASSTNEVPLRRERKRTRKALESDLQQVYGQKRSRPHNNSPSGVDEVHFFPVVQTIAASEPEKVIADLDATDWNSKSKEVLDLLEFPAPLEIDGVFRFSLDAFIDAIKRNCLVDLLIMIEENSEELEKISCVDPMVIEGQETSLMAFMFQNMSFDNAVTVSNMLLEVKSHLLAELGESLQNL